MVAYQAETQMKILVMNAGSSSLKCELYPANGGAVDGKADWEAQADWSEVPGPASLNTQRPGLPAQKTKVQVRSLEETVEQLLRGLTEGSHAVIQSFDEVGITGHRVVHGGGRFRESMLLTEDVRREIRALAPFAPLHNPLALEAIEATEAIVGNGSPQAVVFDTSFHASLPPRSYLYPGPREWEKQGLRRYGFHGISHQYVSGRAGEIAAPLIGKPASELRMISCHLGNGCSLCAIDGGRSVETTMGFTPLEGLMMGSRSGTVDPGLLLYLLKHEGMTADELDSVLNTESGLKGLSGISSDMRQVEAAAAEGDAHAAEALDVYTYRLAYFISALLPSMGGIDALVFTAGVGENSALVRARTCEQLGYLNLFLDPVLNNQPACDRVISAPDSQVLVMVIQTRENYQIANECMKLMRLR
jgi:acetate kinase